VAGLMTGLASLHQGNREPSVVKSAVSVKEINPIIYLIQTDQQTTIWTPVLLLYKQVR